MTDEFDAQTLDYASTPLRALALSEVPAGTVGQPEVMKTLNGNLAALEHLIPVEYATDLDTAHEYFDRTVFMSVCASVPIIDRFVKNYDDDATRMPLIMKVNLALMGNPELATPD